ncbi:MAG: permease [Fuerstiella sp.]|nr:permease [Fuerstiella sp.]
MVDAIWSIWLELAPWLLLGAVVAGLMHVVVPTGWLHRHLSGRMGVAKAVLVGIPLPLCSCGVIPVGLGLRSEGASRGASVGFLISTPQTGVDSILVSVSFLGWPFALLKVVVALVTGLVGGLVTNIGEVADEQLAHSTAANPEGLHSRSPATISKPHAFLDQTIDIVRSIWGWLFVGVVVSAVITRVVPPNAFADVGALTGLSALLVTLLISLPLYVCATASVPIAAALVDSGLPPGAALVFLMAGPATNVATLGAVYRTLGPRSLSVYLTTIVIGSVTAGLAFNHVIDTSVTLHHVHDHVAWWRIVCAVVLAVMVSMFAISDGLRFVRKRRVVSTDGDISITLQVDGMTCDGCAARLERMLEASDGIERADASFTESRVTVSGSAAHDAVAEAVLAAGFSVSSDAPSVADK